MVNSLGNNFSAQNSIANFNKLFSQHLQQVDNNFAQIQMPDFDNLLNQKTQEMMSTPPLRTGIEINAGYANIPNLDLSMQEASIVSQSSIENALDGFGKSFANGIAKIALIMATPMPTNNIKRYLVISCTFTKVDKLITE